MAYSVNLVSPLSKVLFIIRNSLPSIVKRFCELSTGRSTAKSVSPSIVVMETCTSSPLLYMHLTENVDTSRQREEIDFNSLEGGRNDLRFRFIRAFNVKLRVGFCC